MNGIILKGLRGILTETGGEDAWTAIHERAGLERRLYMPSSDYPDDTVAALVDAAVIELGVAKASLLTQLGRTIGPEFVQIYDVHIRREWDATDVVANFDRILYGGVTKNRFTTFEAPRVTCQRVGERTIQLEYDDDRNLCSLFVGLLESIGEEFGEEFVVDHTTCRKDGAFGCELLVTPIEEPVVASAGHTHTAPEAELPPEADVHHEATVPPEADPARARPIIEK